MNRSNWFPEILNTCDQFKSDANRISRKRQKELESVANYIAGCKASDQIPQLIVICTHNSRRSHFGQIWLQLAAEYYGIELRSFSGGTEATAFHPNAVSSIERKGFQVVQGGGDNPRYQLSYTNDRPAITCFSKKFDDQANPQDQFAALLVCDSAAESCPIVHGADERFVLPYRDPKEYDGTELEKIKYDERCFEIGREMFFLISIV